MMMTWATAVPKETEAATQCEYISKHTYTHKKKYKKKPFLS